MDIPSLSKRLGPDPELDAIFAGVRELIGPEALSDLIQDVLGAARIDQIVAQSASNAALIARLERDADVLREHRWVLSGIVVPVEAFQRAVDAYEDRRNLDAEQILAAAWTAELREAVVALVTTVYLDENTRPIAQARRDLLAEASALHDEQRFAGAIPILLAQADGIVGDLTGGTSTLFHRGQEVAVDDETIAGHPNVLDAVRAELVKGCQATRIGGVFNRHATLHGRDVGYATEANAARAWCLLTGVIEWAQPRARALPS